MDVNRIADKLNNARYDYLFAILFHGYHKILWFILWECKQMYILVIKIILYVLLIRF